MKKWIFLLQFFNFPKSSTQLKNYPNMKFLLVCIFEYSESKVMRKGKGGVGLEGLKTEERQVA